MSRKTTKRQLKIFTDEVHKWINVFGLQGWRIWCLLGDTDGAGANVETDLDQHQAHIRLSQDYEETWGWDDKYLKQYAFHEVCHIWLSRLAHLAEERYVREDEISEEVHNVIRTLENVIFYQ